MWHVAGSLRMCIRQDLVRACQASASSWQEPGLPLSNQTSQAEHTQHPMDVERWDQVPELGLDFISRMEAGEVADKPFIHSREPEYAGPICCEEHVAEWMQSTFHKLRASDWLQHVGEQAEPF